MWCCVPSQCGIATTIDELPSTCIIPSSLQDSNFFTSSGICYFHTLFTVLNIATLRSIRWHLPDLICISLALMMLTIFSCALLAICAPSLEKCLQKPFTYFWIELFLWSLSSDYLTSYYKYASFYLIEVNTQSTYKLFTRNLFMRQKYIKYAWNSFHAFLLPDCSSIPFPLPTSYI